MYVMTLNENLSKLLRYFHQVINLLIACWTLLAQRMSPALMPKVLVAFLQCFVLDREAKVASAMAGLGAVVWEALWSGC